MPSKPKKSSTKKVSVLGQAIIDDITNGLHDSDLQHIAKAAFARHQLLQGDQELGAHLTESVSQTEVSPTEVLSEKNRLAGWPVDFFAVGNRTSGHDDKSLVYYDIFGDAVGRTYEKDRFKGRQFVIEPGTYNTDRFDGLVAKVVGMGPSKVMVEFNPINDACSIDNKDGTGRAYLYPQRLSYLFG